MPDGKVLSKRLIILNGNLIQVKFILIQNRTNDKTNKQITNHKIQACNLNAEDDFENEYLRYGGAVGVRNPRLVRKRQKQKTNHLLDILTQS